LRLFSFGGYGLALAALALVVFGAYDSYPIYSLFPAKSNQSVFMINAHTSSVLDALSPDSLSLLKNRKIHKISLNFD